GVDLLPGDVQADGRLGPDLAAVALHDDPVALDLEELLAVAEHPRDQELEGRVGGLVLVPAELALLELLDQALELRALLVELDPELPGLHGEAAPASHVGDEHPRPVAHDSGVDVLVAALDLLRRVR